MRILEEALTFDDVLLVPAYSEILPREVDLATRLTKAIKLNVPLVSAAMDTVTEARLAITMAQEGGIGIVHKSMTDRRPGAEGAPRQEVRERRDPRPDHGAAGHDHPAGHRAN
jgi:IMP dehydrogenase